MGSFSKRLITHSQYSGGRNNARSSFGAVLDSRKSVGKCARNICASLLLCWSGVVV